MMCSIHSIISICGVLMTVFHGFGGRMTVSDVGPTTVNKIMELCFKEIGLKKRDLNGQTPFGRLISSLIRAMTNVRKNQHI